VGSGTTPHIMRPIRGVAHLEGSGQEGIVHHALRLLRTGHVFRSRFLPLCRSCDVVASRLSSSVVSAQSELHQSPIRIKTAERSSWRFDSSPWHTVPQTTVGSRLCPPYRSTGCLAASGLAPTPSWLTAEALQCQRSCNNPQMWSMNSPHPLTEGGMRWNLTIARRQRSYRPR